MSHFRLLGIALATVAAGPMLAHSDAGSPDHQHPRGKKAAFIENKGQLPSQVMFRADFGTIALFAEKDRFTWSRLQDDVGELVHADNHKRPEERVPFNIHGHAWQVRFDGANPDPVITRTGRSTAILNWFIGNDPSKWASDVHYYDEVKYSNVWPGADLQLRGGPEGGFEYDVLLANAAALPQVRFAYDGLEAMQVDREGHLVMRTSLGEQMEAQPQAWYADGAKEKLECRFTLSGNVVGFRFKSEVDPSRPIVVDPLLIASTLSGTGDIGTTQNYGHTATYDEAGNIYTGCICFGQGYPATPGAFDLTYGGGFGVDIGISKLNPDGSALIYATYLGGNGGDYPHSLVVTPTDELCVYGSTDSQDFPTTANAFDQTQNGQADITVTKLNVNGTALIGSTFVGTNQNDGRNQLTWNYGDSYRGEIISDLQGRPIIASCSSGAFPTTPGAYQTTNAGGQDGVVFMLNEDLSAMVWSTMLGTSQDDMCFGVKLDSNGDPYVCGGTAASNFPTTPGVYQTASTGGQESFISHFSGGVNTLAQSTYFGGTGDDDAFFLQLDIDGDVYIYGQSELGSITISPPGTYGQAGADIYVAEFSSDLSTNIFKSVVGDPGGWGTSCVPVAFLVDVCSHIYISGYSTSGGTFETTGGALYTDGGFYLAAYDVDMSGLLYGTYYQGASHVDGGTSRFDSNGIIYQAVCTSGPFPTTPNAFSNTQPAGWDIGVFKIDFQVAGVNAAGASTQNSGCAPIDINFLNTSTGTNWVWDFGDGSPLDTTYTPTHTYTTPGVFTVTLIALDSLSCNLADTVDFEVTIGESQPLNAAFTAVQNDDCTLSQVSTTNQSTGSPLAFVWDMGDGSAFLTDTNVVHNYDAPGTYPVELLVYDPTGCSQPDSVTLNVVIAPPIQVHAAFTVEQVPDCSDLIVSTNNQSDGPAPTYEWDMGDGTILAGLNVTHTYSTPGTYTITLTATDSATCNIVDDTLLNVTVVEPQPVSAAFLIDQTFSCDSMEATTTNQSEGSFLGFVWDFGDGSPFSSDTNIVHTYVGAGTYTVTLIVNDLLGCSPSDTATADLVIDPLVPVVADFTSQQYGDCTLLNVGAINQSTGDSVSYSWDMGDGTILNTEDVLAYTYTDPGTYTITLTVTDLGCGQDDAISIPVTVINTLPVVFAGDPVVCPGLTTTIDASGSNVTNYLWSTGEITPSITVDQGGDYIVQVFTSVCEGTDTIHVTEQPFLVLGDSIDACPNAYLNLTIPLEGQSYSWSTGGTGRTEQVIGAGHYIFTVIDPLGCSYTDSIVVHALSPDARLFAPNAFTPDGDGMNDDFAITGYGEQDVELTIFNRWGEQVFATKTLDNRWDGNYGGTQAKQEVYVYRLKYNAQCEETEYTTAIGCVTVLR